MPYQEEISTSNSLLKIGFGVILLSFVVSTGLWWYLTPIKPSETTTELSPNISELACKANEIKNFADECIPKPPSLAKLQNQVEDIRGQLDTINLKESKVESLTVKLDGIQSEIEAVQVNIHNSPESYELNVLQEQLTEQQKRQKQLAKMLLADKNIPKCLSSASTELQKKLPMFLVPAVQERSPPKNLQVWMKKITKLTEAKFFIMRREVTAGEFQAYVDTLDDEQRLDLEDTWQESLSKDNPVTSITWKFAKGYADWLAAQTGCPLTLPTNSQWATATLRYDADPSKAIIRETLGQKPRQRAAIPSGVVDLLANLREWSIEECGPDSHFLLGEDYKTYQDNIIGEPICESSTLGTVGFRLVLSE